MKLLRRTFLLLAGSAAALPWSLCRAAAQAYPTRPVRLLIPSTPGGVTDITGRLIAQWLSGRLDQPFVIENRPGGGGNIATEAAVRAAADGYTLVLTSTANAINATLYERLTFNFIRDIEPVAGLTRAPNVLVVHPSFPARTVPEFVAYAKANPGKINVASGGTGTSQHLAGELFNMMAGVRTVHVPYRGGAPALADLLGGQVEAMFYALAPSIEYIRAGKLRALAVTSVARADVLPDLPTLGEFLPGYEASAWFGIGAPKNTPAEILDRLNTEINAALADRKIATRLAELGANPLILSRAAFGKMIADETEKWGRVVRAVNIRAE